MKIQDRDKWVADLRSGRYVQGSGLLSRVVLGQETHCALGVLVEGQAVAQGIRKRYYRGDSISGYAYSFSDGYETVTHPPDGFAGLKRMTINKVSLLNDLEGLTFEEIADWIETNIPVTAHH